MMSFFRKVSPYTAGLFFPLFALFVFAGAGRGILVFIAFGSLLLQLIINAVVEVSGKRMETPDTKRHLIKLVFAILLNSLLLAVHGFWDLSDISLRRYFFIFVVVGISLLVKDYLMITRKIPGNQSEKGKSGLAQYAKIIAFLALGIVLIIVINIAILRYGPAKAPYFWANQITASSEIDDLNDAVILFSRATCPSCIEAERYLRDQPKQNRKALYYYDTDKFREDESFQAILQKYHVESVPTLVVIIDGLWTNSYSLVSDDDSIDEKAIEDAFYQYHLGVLSS